MLFNVFQLKAIKYLVEGSVNKNYLVEQQPCSVDKHLEMTKD